MVGALMLSTTTLFSQTTHHKAEVTLYYRYDKSNLDASYLTNPSAFRQLDRLMESYEGAIDSIVVVAHASPEGKVAYNQALSERRAATMERYLRDHFKDMELPPLKVYPRGEDFDGMIRMIEQDKKVPHKKEVLRILSQKDVHPDTRVRQLISLRDGYPYSYIRRNILPWLRTATTCIVYFKTTEPPVVVTPPSVEEQPEVVMPEVPVVVPTEEPTLPVVAPQYTYVITREPHYIAGSEGEPTVLSDSTTLFVVTLREKGEVVGVYKVVAPKSTTNLTGTYNIVTAPRSVGESLGGPVNSSGRPLGSYAVVDGRVAAITGGSYTLLQDEEDVIDVRFLEAHFHFADGTTQSRPFEQLRATGEGLTYTPPTIIEEEPIAAEEEPIAEEEPEVVAEPIDYLVALKTNLLFDALAAVNVAAEIPIGNRYSVEASWLFPWYVARDWNWCYELLWGDVEGRYWLGERTRDNRLKGHFVGLYAGGGLYDFQLRSTDGYQGEFFLAAGVSYGYSMELGRGWNMEFELGVGYLQSDYRHYFHITEPDGTHKLIRDRITGRFGYWGPTKARISLVRPIEWSVDKSRRNRMKRVETE